MASEQGFYDGRRGHRRLKAIEKQTEKVLNEFTTGYEDSPELRFLQDEIRWEGTSQLLFAMARRNVHFEWNGIRDYGFIRLCAKWIEEEGVATMTPKAAADMTRSILPEEMCRELGEELSALEIY